MDPLAPVYVRFDRFEDDVPRRGLRGGFVQLHLLNVLHDKLHVLIGVLGHGDALCESAFNGMLFFRINSWLVEQYIYSFYC